MASTEMMGSYWVRNFEKEIKQLHSWPVIPGAGASAKSPAGQGGNGEPDTFSIDNGDVLNVMIMP